ncbi:MAG: hypothetical protein U5K84_12155 [Alkalibacterium sp.]|nr:hypothetical protein [Alkalibacterium sp.]
MPVVNIVVPILISPEAMASSVRFDVAKHLNSSKQLEAGWTSKARIAT